MRTNHVPVYAGPGGGVSLSRVRLKPDATKNGRIPSNVRLKPGATKNGPSQGRHKACPYGRIRSPVCVFYLTAV
jgi:hypothetical protein